MKYNYNYAIAITIRQQYGIRHAAHYLADRGCPIEVALDWLL